MSKGVFVFTAVLALQTTTSFAECPNACSGHGACGLFDSCYCYPNWIGGDCGERVCPFGRSFADTPKGDLDGSETLDTTTVLVGSEMYPLGTNEEFPEFKDVLDNRFGETAHDYFECANVGICDRSTGQCACFPGYEGSACQRTVCPTNAMGVCSGHGKCSSVAQMSSQSDQIYELWDKEKQYACHCDPGYHGADCLHRYCPMDVDPKFLQDKNQIVPTTRVAFSIYDRQCEKALGIELYPFLRRLTGGGVVEKDREELQTEYLRRRLVSETDAEADKAAEDETQAEYDSLPDEASRATMRRLTQTQSPTNLPTSMPTIARLHTDATLTGTFALKFYDAFGEDYTTKPIILEDYTKSKDSPTVSSCSDIVNALEALPNTVISHDTIRCEEQAVGAGYGGECGVTYSLTYTGNPGYLKDLEVDYYLDGQRPTIFNHFGEAGVNVTTEIYPLDNAGPVDYWATKCDGVEVITSWLANDLLDVNKWGYLRMEDGHYASLAKCLGDSNGIESDNVEVYNWDYGSWSSPIADDDPAYALNGGSEDGGTRTYTSIMSGNPHIIRLVPTDYHDVHDSTQLALVWVDQQTKPSAVGDSRTTGYTMWMASPPESTTTTYIPYATDGTAELVYVDNDENHELHASGQYEPRVTARFTRGSKLIYTSHDTACETASNLINPCLDKGDMIFLFDANWGTSSPSSKSNFTLWGGAGYHQTKTENSGSGTFFADRNYNVNTGVPYTINKIYKTKASDATYGRSDLRLEDRYRIQLDKSINWGNEETMEGLDPDGDGVKSTGYVQMIKFSPATTGNYKFFDECSGRGICDTSEGSCMCVDGYEGIACEIFDTLAM